MTQCNRCGTEFDNWFNGYHWCPDCGKVFVYDENCTKKQKDETSYSDLVYKEDTITDDKKQTNATSRFV